MLYINLRELPPLSTFPLLHPYPSSQMSFRAKRSGVEESRHRKSPNCHHAPLFPLTHSGDSQATHHLYPRPNLTSNLPQRICPLTLSLSKGRASYATPNLPSLFFVTPAKAGAYYGAVPGWVPAPHSRLRGNPSPPLLSPSPPPTPRVPQRHRPIEYKRPWPRISPVHAEVPDPLKLVRRARLCRRHPRLQLAALQRRQGVRVQMLLEVPLLRFLHRKQMVI